jgi:hypothetical protein
MAAVIVDLDAVAVSGSRRASCIANSSAALSILFTGQASSNHMPMHR